MTNKEKILNANCEGKLVKKKKEQVFCLEQLEDSSFKSFYLKNLKERKYLFSKVDSDRLAEFAAMEFGLVDILKCKYIKMYRRAVGIDENKFKEDVLNYEPPKPSQPPKNNSKKGKSQKTESPKSELEKFKKIKRDAVEFIQEDIEARKTNNTKKLLMNFDSFTDNQTEYLIKTFKYIFDDKKIMKRFEYNKRNNYKFNSLEAMLIFYIMDNYNEGDYKRIRNKNINLVSKSFMKSLKRYAIAIDEYRNLKDDCSELREIYKTRLVETKSDLPGIYYSLNKLEKELTKKDDINFENLEEEIKICRKKLKKLLKSIRKKAKKARKKNKESTQS